MTLDGARAWNASVALGISMKEKVKNFDLISVCMSKGMGSPMGSLIVGSHEDIRSAMNYRKILGGSMRQTGLIAACGLVSLQDWQEKLASDHANAAFLAAELSEIKGINIDPKSVETNVIYFKLEQSLLDRLKIDYRGFAGKLKENYKVLSGAGFNNDFIRVVTHRDVSRPQIEQTIQAIKDLTA